MSIFTRLLIAITLVVVLHGSSQAQVVYSELVDGELSGDSDNPTDLGLFLPASDLITANSVTGQVTAIGAGGFGGTADVFTFEIGAGHQLDSIFLTSFSTVSGAAVFVALDDGPTFQYTAPEINDQFNLPDLSQILGGTVAGTANVDFDIDVLADLENAVNLGNGSAFNVPLGPGQYSFYIQETGPESDYTFAFNVSDVAAIPEPSSLAVLGVLGAGYAWRRRKRRANK